MRQVAVLVAASPTRAFYSQVAALRLALHRLRWSRWQPSVHLYVGGSYGTRRPSKIGCHIWAASRSIGLRQRVFALDGDWAQSDDVFMSAPPDADVLLAMDADTLPVDVLEPVLDDVWESGAVAGVIAHYPPFPQAVGPGGDASLREAWRHLAKGLLDTPLDFSYCHTLIGSEVQHEQRVAPFYLNFGVVFFPRDAFHSIAPQYLAIRPQLMQRMSSPDFSGQAALTLAIASEKANTVALPMRYNFPNDPIAEQMYPAELDRAVVFHYLRTDTFDRHQIFVTTEQDQRFLALHLQGVNRRFQEAVRTIIGERYPFALRSVWMPTDLQAVAKQLRPLGHGPEARIPKSRPVLLVREEAQFLSFREMCHTGGGCHE